MPPAHATAFIGRAPELAALHQLHAQPGCHIAVVYGRRRIGKTALINRAFADQFTLSFEGLENRGKRVQIDNFLFQLERQAGVRIARIKAIRQWREAFIELVPLLKDKHVILFLDEMQWIANYRSDLVSDLKMVWEQYLIKAGRITLVLCGSIASFMERKVVKSKALYGRTDLTIHLKPFLLPETRHLLTHFGEEDVLLAQLLVGGVPQYLNLLSQQPSVAAAMDQLAFTKSGFFSEEFERIFVSHFGASEIYGRIVGLLADAPYGLSRAEILDKLRLSAGGELTQNLYNMESAGFIATYSPLGRSAGVRQQRFLIEDPFLRFYFAFLEPYKKQGIYQEHHFTQYVLQSPRFTSWLGRSFELLCLQHREPIARLLGFHGIQYAAGPWFQHGKRGVLQGAQFDLVFDRADRVVTACEIKYRSAPIGVEVIKEMEAKLAAAVVFQKRTVQRVLITKSEPTRELQASSYFSRIVRATELF